MINQPHVSAAIRRTADNAALCKWSLLECGYLENLQLSSKMRYMLRALATASSSSPRSSLKAQSPLTNQCYNLRCQVIWQVVSRFLDRTHASKKKGIIINLGCGMDGLLLALISKTIRKIIMCEEKRKELLPLLMEIDVKEVVEMKMKVLREVHAYTTDTNVITENEDTILNSLLSGQNESYQLLQGDLRNLSNLQEHIERRLHHQDHHNNSQEYLFILEAVLGYMEESDVSRLLRWCGSLLGEDRQVHLLVVDSGLVKAYAGYDSVAASVASAFARNGCPLNGFPSTWKDMSEVIYDMKQYGWRHSLALNLLDAFILLLLDDEKGDGNTSSKEEVFDEFPALHVFGRQSLVILASSNTPELLDHLSTMRHPHTATPKSLINTKYEILLSTLAQRISVLEKLHHDRSATENISSFYIRPLNAQNQKETQFVRKLLEEGRLKAAEGRPKVAKFLKSAFDKEFKDMESAYQGHFWILIEMHHDNNREEEVGSERIVGCVGLKIWNKEDDRDGGVCLTGEIVRLSIDPLFQRKGLGTKLIKYVENYARSHVDVLTVTTLDNEALAGASKFYEKQGYKLNQIKKFGVNQGEMYYFSKVL